MNVVIYARFSSHSQTEQSIEGQLKVCYEYAESNHYTVVGEYIDRAISGTTDNRAEFQRMISDSDKHTFEGVLENMAEYYSVELSQKIHRGMAINAEKCLSNGSNPGLGFKVDAERRFYVDEEEAAVVREIYERYASGETKAEIIRDLKRRRVKTSLGKEFSPNSLSHLLSNKRYIGVYLYKGKETPGGMPRILDDDLFYRVQSMMNKNKNAPARTHGEGEYLLTTKLFCGHCKEMMVGYGGTSKTGRQYHYYMCKNARRKKCGKKIVSKSYIEDCVVNECLKMLTEEKIRFIAKKVAEECAKSPDNLTAKALKKAIREANTAIENLWKAIEQGQAVEMLTDRLNKRMAEKAELEDVLYKCTSRSDGMPKSGGGDRMGSLVARVADLQDDLAAELDRYLRVRDMITAKIGCLKDERYRDVLVYRYVAGLDWGSVAKVMHYSIDHVYRLHGGALVVYGEIER